MFTTRPETSRIFTARRERLLNDVLGLIQDRQTAAALRRRAFFQPDKSSPAAYAASLPPFREKLRALLGWWPVENAGHGEVEFELLSEDATVRVFQVNSPGIGRIEGSGLLFLPTERARRPLVVALHGGQGSPELAAGLAGDGSANYNRMITGLRERSVAIYAPQLLVWHEAQEPVMNQYQLDRRLRHCGGSRAALDLALVQLALDGLVLHPEIDGDRVGVSGLSYGGFYALFLAALDERIKVAVSSCFLNDRHRYDWEDLVWTDAANFFLDAEVGQMVCPRPLFLEVGQRDEVFSPDAAPAIARSIGETYAKLGLAERFAFRVHVGGHEYDPDGKAQEFLLRHLFEP